MVYETATKIYSHTLPPIREKLLQNQKNILKIGIFVKM